MKATYGRKGFLRAQSIMVVAHGGSKLRQLDTLHLLGSRERCWHLNWLPLSSLFILSGAPDHGMCCPSSKWVLVNLWDHHHRHSLRCVSNVTPHPGSSENEPLQPHVQSAPATPWGSCCSSHLKIRFLGGNGDWHHTSLTQSPCMCYSIRLPLTQDLGLSGKTKPSE